MAPILKPDEIDALLDLFKSQNNEQDSFQDVPNSESPSENDGDSNACTTDR